MSPALRSRWRVRPRSRRELLLGAAEIAAVITVVTALIAALQHLAPPTGLGVLYLLAVLLVAIRWGQMEALLTALLSMLVLNYLFITPRHRLAIAHGQDVVELVVLLITASVVGRLAALGREQAAEARRRAELAVRREREATLIAGTASAILAGADVRAALERLARGSTGAGVRVSLDSVPEPRPGETATALRAGGRHGWLYTLGEAGWQRDDAERLAEPLGRLVEVAVERDRLAAQATEAEAARRTEAARTAILHAVSHDLRSPLTAIATASAALGTRAVTESERAELVEVIDGEAARLAKLVDDLLDISRIEAGAVDPQADWCDLHDVISTAAGEARPDHPVEFALPEELSLVRADAAQLERVFSNLIENAVKHSPPGKPVRVSATEHGGRITVRVVDHGQGIPVAHRSRVFEPFFRGRREGGSGLGLAICRGFVEANGGQIVAGSDRGGGASIAVSFPVAPQPKPEPAR